MHEPTEHPHDGVRSLTTELMNGQTNRRDFIRRAVALGLSSLTIGSILAACGGETGSPTAATGASTAPASAAPASSAPASSAAASAAASAAPAGVTATRPAGTAASGAATPAGGSAQSVAVATPMTGGPTKRGGGGTLKLLQWQAATVLNPQMSQGTKDSLACSPVYEALLTFDIDGKFVPILAAEIPSQANGGLSADGKTVTMKLKQGVKWSDGKPFTADDVVFTWEYVTDKETAATGIASYDAVTKVEKVDDTTVKFIFGQPNPAWFRPAQVAVIPRHIFQADKGANAKNSQNNLKPVGTGPYKVTDFKPGDTVTYVINENYREATKPFFDQVQLKGGGDAASAARAVLQTGDYDYAWNLQLEDSILKQLEAGGKGVVEYAPGGGIERFIYQLADPNKEVDGERANPNTKHPFLSDPKVRKAFTMGSNLESVVSALYGRGGIVTANILNDPPQFRSPNNKFEYSLEKAAALLDEAGWKKGATYRAKDGVEMAVVFETSINTVRQKTQQIIKDGWEKLGIRTELKTIDSAVYFSADPGNPDTNSKFYADVEMFTGTPVIDPQSDMIRWYSKSIASKANTWSGRNYQRYNNPEYDQAWEAAQSELDPQKRAQLFIKMNDILIQGSVVVPVVDRKTVFARTKTLQNVNFTPWDSDYWNIANWIK